VNYNLHHSRVSRNLEIWLFNNVENKDFLFPVCVKNRFMKIYTKTGDNGETSLLGGQRVSKTNMRIQAIGTVDELNAWLGLIGDQVLNKQIIEQVRHIQGNLFILGANLTSDDDFKNKTDLAYREQKFSFPILTEQDVDELEVLIDTMTVELRPLKNFILPGGDTSVSYCHLARAVARRAERVVVQLSQTIEINPIFSKYLNRLSDYLFVLARKIIKDNNITEIEWQGM